MSSSYRGLVTPDYADPADVPASFKQFVDSGPIPRFPNEATRNAAIPSPVKGTVAYIETAPGGEYFSYFNGSLWTRLVPLPPTILSNGITYVAGTIPAWALNGMPVGTPAAFPSASATVKGILRISDSQVLADSTIAASAMAMSRTVSKASSAVQIMVGPLRLPVGSVSAPALQLSNDNTGFYVGSGGTIRSVIGGASIFEFNANALGSFGRAGFTTASGFTTTNELGMAWDTTGGILVAVRTSGAAMFIGRNGTEGGAIDFRRAGVQKGTVIIESDGVVYATSSDVRLKENIKDADKADLLSMVLGLKPRNFRWKDSKNNALGMISQEVVEVYPAAVSKGEGDGFWQLDYSKLVPLLVGAVQELAAQVAALTPEPEGI